MYGNRSGFQLMTMTLALASVAACSKPSPTDDSLQRDLQAASSSLTMLPNGGGTAIVSAIEQTPSAAPVAAKRQNAPKRTPQRAPAKVVAETQDLAHDEMPAPRTAPEQPTREDLPATPTPRAPQGRATQPPPPGGFKTIEEVMRKAPFPINP